MGSRDANLETMWDELVRLCNEQFESPPFKRLLNISFTRERAQHYSIQMAFYVQNRRDCWGYVQGSAPLDIKRMIWRHEEDELIGRKAEGKIDHIALAVREGEVLGLSAEAFERAARLDVLAPGFDWRSAPGWRPLPPRRYSRCATQAS
jgi:hypothetical protein